MSLPPGFLDELRARLSIVDVVGRKVMWDNRKSNQAKGDWWAPCPFHQEKTASFHVEEGKGYYYCFGCHAKGDAITFVRETENLGFMEAVKVLAEEAGMPMPEADPRAQEKADRRTELVDVMEQAVRFYRMQLKTGAAAEARDYLSRRGLDAAALDRFEIGFAPPGWQTLWDHLRGKGVAQDLILDAGLARESQKGKEPYDTFRHRILFPIRDARGRAIAFGGRAMDPGDTAKYLNSPETPIFDKGRNLYNHGPAREAARKGQPLIVAEGYMDVIALVRAGFEAAVAPLGTAVTEHQLAALWKIHPEPVIALDGDAAGVRAAMRLVDLALPMLAPGKTLRFCVLPAGQDPDDLIRDAGAASMARLVEGAEPLVRMLWRRETDGKTFDSPERKAALERALQDAAAKITDKSVSQHYAQELKDLRWQLFRPQRGFKSKPLPSVTPAQATALAQGNAATVERLREAVILATLVIHPVLIDEFADALEQGAIRTPDLQPLAAALLRFGNAPDLTQRLRETVDSDTLENLTSAGHVQLAPGVRRTDDTDVARHSVAEELEKLAARRGAERELVEAVEDIEALSDEGLTWRLGQVAEALNPSSRDGQEDKTEYDIAPNGAAIRRDERNALDALLAQIGHVPPDPRKK
ncbi:MAG: DNA primase [Pseudomonadota bacterium]